MLQALLNSHPQIALWDELGSIWGPIRMKVWPESMRVGVMLQGDVKGHLEAIKRIKWRRGPRVIHLRRRSKPSKLIEQGLEVLRKHAPYWLEIEYETLTNGQHLSTMTEVQASPLLGFLGLKEMKDLSTGEMVKGQPKNLKRELQAREHLRLIDKVKHADL